MNSRKQRIIIHTGPGKTGSSAIQAWLVSQESFLKKHGIYYPSHKLATDKISSGNLTEILTHQADGLWKVDANKVTSLLKGFKQSDYSVLLLSSEFFFHNIVDIKQHIPDAEFIAYVRNPVELLESNYNQAVKRHSKIHRFVPPEALNHYFWQYLSNVFDKVDNADLYLRPYDKTLMQGGNIVSDLLSVLHIEIDVEDKKINPSFTFQCLEFKRLLNHFGLGPLEPQLDAILQGCDIGERSYSLMAAEAFKALNNESCQQMKLFINKYKQDKLQPLLVAFTEANQRPFIKQALNLEDLTKIADYLSENDALLYRQISSILTAHPNLSVDNPSIYKAFAVEASPFNKSELLSDLLLKHINQFTVHPSKRGTICFELACYYQQLNDIDNALVFAKGSHYFNPGHMRFTSKLNEIIKSWNIKYREAEEIVYQPSKKEVFSAKVLRRFKSKLARK